MSSRDKTSPTCLRSFIFRTCLLSHSPSRWLPTLIRQTSETATGPLCPYLSKVYSKVSWTHNIRATYYFTTASNLAWQKPWMLSCGTAAATQSHCRKTQMQLRSHPKLTATMLTNTFFHTSSSTVSKEGLGQGTPAPLHCVHEQYTLKRLQPCKPSTQTPSLLGLAVTYNTRNPTNHCS